jgi:hypothetical protein
MVPSEFLHSLALNDRLPGRFRIRLTARRHQAVRVGPSAVRRRMKRPSPKV